MTLVEEFKNIDFTDPYQEKSFTEKASLAISELDVTTCRDVDIFLDAYWKEHANFFNEQKEGYEKLRKLQYECQWVSLSAISQEKVLKLFGKYIHMAWGMPKKYNMPEIEEDKYSYQNDLISKNLEANIRLILLYNEQDIFKNKLQDILINNEEIFTESKIVSEDKKIKPTLANWFKVYHEAVGTGSTNRLKMAEFFSKNKNFQALTEPEQAKLKMIFDLYEKLKLSSLTPEGNIGLEPFTDEKGRPGYVYAGEFTPSPVDIKAEPSVPQPTEDEKRKDFNKVDNYKPTDEKRGVVHDIFSDIDAKEIKEHSQSGLSKGEPANEKEILDSLKQKYSLTFTDEVLENRFDNLASSYMRGIRDNMEFKGMLTRPQDVGGLDYQIDVAQGVIDFLDNKESAPKPEAKKTEPKIMPEPVPEPEKPGLSLNQAQVIMKKASQAQAKAKASPAPPKPPAPKPMPVPKPAKPKTPPPVASIIPKVKRFASKKPVVHDVKIPAKEIKLVGPIEELRAIDLNKFRNFANTPYEAAEKIMAKIALLEEQSFTDKAQGVVAFKNSPVNKLYLQIGNQSIDRGISVQEIIDKMLDDKQESLTKQEFDVIADLNKKLRF